MRYLVMAAVAAVMVGVAAFASGTPGASANSSGCSGNGCAAWASFKSYGEHFLVCDQVADGYSAAVWYKGNPDGKDVLINSGGAGTCKDFDLSIPEPHPVVYFVCLANNGDLIESTCGALIEDTAKNPERD